MPKIGLSPAVRYLRRFRSKDQQPEPRHPRCAYVLSGGGVYGAEQVGMIRALVEGGYPPDLVSAVSVGSLNGVVMAQDPSLVGVEQLERIWRTVEAKTLFPGGNLHRAMSLIMRRDHLCENTGVKKLIDDNVRVEVFEDLKVPLYVSTAELVSGAHRIFHSGPLRRVLLASAALPGVFPPVEVDGVAMIDGGVVSSIPTSPAVSARPERLFILDVSRPVSTKVPHTPIGVMIQAINITRNLCAARDLEAARVLTGAIVLPRPGDEPAVAFDDTEHTEELMRLGYERTQRFLAEEFPKVA